MVRLAPYAEVHKPENLQGPGDARPTATQIVEDQGLVGSRDWAGRVVLVTGVSRGGIGLETAKALHLTGADVYITSRDRAHGQELAREIGGDGQPGKVDVVGMDLGSLDSVRAAAAEFLQKSNRRLHVLVNNAGTDCRPLCLWRARTDYCVEESLPPPRGKRMTGSSCSSALTIWVRPPSSPTNHDFPRPLTSETQNPGHFLLFQLLKDALVASASPAFASRVVVVSSALHRHGIIHLDDLHFEKRAYEPWAAYAQSKLANVLFANELDRRYRDQGVRALSVHPGGILTRLGRHLPSPDHIPGGAELQRTMKSPAQGAATTLWAAVAQELEGKGGIYLDEVAEGWPAPPDALDYHGGYAPQAFDPPTEQKLWEESARLTGANE